MTQITITCPECKHEFSPDQSLKHQLDHMMQDERATLQAAFVQKEKEFAQKSKELNQKEVSLEAVITERLRTEKGKLQLDIERKVREDVSTEVTGLRKELDEKQQQLNQAKELQLENERLKREAKAKETEIRLKVEQEQAEKQAEWELQITQRESERHHLKLAEKDKQLNDLKKQLEIMQQKAEQGSIQTQGEVQELALEEVLQEVFRFDSVTPIQKGANGADILQTVRTEYGNECGVIALESKRTKSFDEKWITKLKEDMRQHRAHQGILVTQTMPKDMTSFGLRNGVWVCSFREAVALIAAVRHICITEHSIRQSEHNRDSKVHALYTYLTSREFKQRVEGIIQATTSMKANVDKERKKMLAFWKSQEVEIDHMTFLITDVVGSIEGLSGNTLGPVKGLSLLDTEDAAQKNT